MSCAIDFSECLTDIVSHTAAKSEVRVFAKPLLLYRNTMICTVRQEYLDDCS